MLQQRESGGIYRMTPFRDQAVELISAGLDRLDPSIRGEHGIDVAKILEVPPSGELGDYAFPCFALARILRRSPAEIAQTLADAVERPPWLANVQAVSGYVNLTLHRGQLADTVLRAAIQEGRSFGAAPERGKTVVIDYSSPNIAKPFTLGHIRSTVIGESLARIFEHRGYRVIRVNHLGDWGTQFGRLIVAYKRWGDEERLKHEAIKELFRLYVRFHEEAEKDPALEDEGRAWFLRLEQGDPEATELWRRFRALSLEEFQAMYQRLGIRFDDYTGESGYNDVLDQTVEALEQKGLLSVSDGAQVVELGDDMPPCIIRKSDGATLYATRDIAAALRRHEQTQFDWMLYVVDSRQSLHFQQVFAVLKLLGMEWAAGMEHIAFGTLIFGEEIMSTRKGNVIFLEDVLNEAVERVRQIIEERNPTLADKDQVAEMVGVGAVVFNDLVHNRIKDVVFEWDRLLNFDGDTGPYVQYTHARACSVLSRGEEQGELPLESGFSDHEWEDQEIDLIRLLGRFAEVVETAKDAREPSTVARYVLDLAQKFNAFYHGNRILGNERAAIRLALTRAVKEVLAAGLYLLGVQAPEKM